MVLQYADDMQYFKSFCPSSSSVLWPGFWSLLNDVYFGFVFCLCGDSENPVPQKMCLCLCVLGKVEGESVMVFEASVELNS
jgi:hypothetical protein